MGRIFFSKRARPGSSAFSVESEPLKSIIASRIVLVLRRLNAFWNAGILKIARRFAFGGRAMKSYLDRSGLGEKRINDTVIGRRMFLRRDRILVYS